MTSRLPPQCLTCLHWISPLDVGDGTGDTQTCKAYPDQIPDDIWWNRADHRQAQPGDHGVHWQARDAKATFPEYVMVKPGPGPAARAGTRIRNQIDPSTIDLSKVQRDFERRLDALLGEYGPVIAAQREEILHQVRSAVTANDVAALAKVSVSTAAATEALIAGMVDMATDAAQEMSREARRQGVQVDPRTVDASRISLTATAIALLLAEGLTNAAGREAVRRWSPSATGDEVAGAVDSYLRGLSDVFVRDNLGGALSAAETMGRYETALGGPSVALYASEMLDSNTCPPCARVDGRWIGNTDDPDIQSKVEAIYPNGGYAECEGGVRCRGQIVAVYEDAGVVSGGGTGEEGTA